MAIQLLKLASRPMPKITTSQVNRDYFYTWTGVLSSTTFVAGTSVSLTAGDWFHGSGVGSPVSGFVTGEGKECLEINGIMQQSGLYSVTTGAIVLIAPADGLTLHKGYPITFQSYDVQSFVSTTRTFAIP